MTDIMKRYLLALYAAAILHLLPAAGDNGELKVFQLNLWNATTNVPGGEAGVVGILKQTDADIVLLCEATAGRDTSLVSRLAEKLEAEGLHYFVSGSGHPVCMLTKTKPESAEWTCIVPGNEERAILKVNLAAGGKMFSVYSAHLDHRNYQCYLPRGYSGATWKKIDGPVTDEGVILEANRKSFRDESIRAFISEAETDIRNGRTVIIGGDFNEPSHLDWTRQTALLRDHNGAAVRWDCSCLLEQAGFTDSYRKVNPDPVSYPGFTYPAGNADAEKAGLNRLSWAPDADERERIDFIYFQSPDPGFSVKSCIITGPAATVVRNRIVPDDNSCPVFTPEGIWPSDHRGNLAVFRF